MSPILSWQGNVAIITPKPSTNPDITNSGDGRAIPSGR